MDDPICYEFRVISTATGMSVKCCSPQSLPSFKASLELSFSRIMHAHMLQRLFETSVQPNTYNFFLGLIIRQEHVWDLVCRRLALDPRPAALKDRLSLRIQAIWNSLPQADIQNLFDSMSRCIAALIAGRGGYAKYLFRTLVKIPLDLTLRTRMILSQRRTSSHFNE
ncbi:uncharacterized protein TNCV_4669901 [Trichonephila clavipes]|nr:uncharacterized protein TNCV_4669901 [Trichonephila clavipes]